MSNKTRIIQCDECDFEGRLTDREGDFSPSDISYCPACGADITEEYNVAEDDE